MKVQQNRRPTHAFVQIEVSCISTSSPRPGNTFILLPMPPAWSILIAETVAYNQFTTDVSTFGGYELTGALLYRYASRRLQIPTLGISLFRATTVVSDSCWMPPAAVPLAAWTMRSTQMRNFQERTEIVLHCDFQTTLIYIRGTIIMRQVNASNQTYFYAPNNSSVVFSQHDVRHHDLSKMNYLRSVHWNFSSSDQKFLISTIFGKQHSTHKKFTYLHFSHHLIFFKIAGYAM